MLYAGAAALLIAGGVWWVRAAPHVPTTPDVAQWRAAAERLLPEADDAEAGDTIQLSAGAEQEVSANLPIGTHHVQVVCVGGSDSRVRVSLGTYNDTGRAVDCGDRSTPTGFDVALGGGLRMNVESDSSGLVVFRYLVTRVAD